MAKRKAAAKVRGARIPGRLEAEAAALLLLSLAAFVEVSLLSYDARDPWWGFGTSVHNLCGPVGALIARALAGSVGAAAHVLPLAAVVVATRYLRGLPIRARWIPLAAWTLFWVSLSAVFEVMNRSGLPGGAARGGLVGGLIVDGMQSALYLAGTSLVLGIALVTSLLVATGASIRDSAAWGRRVLRSLGRQVGQTTVVGWVRARRRWKRWRELRRDQKLAAPRPEAPRVPLPRPRRRGEPEVVEHRAETPPPARQQALPFGAGDRPGPFELPDMDMLALGTGDDVSVDRDFLIQNSRVLEKKLLDFGVKGRVVKVHPGPVITMYEFEPAPGIKVSRIVNLADDLALALRALSVRIVAPIPGTSVVGVEVPNSQREVVLMRQLLSHPSYCESTANIPISLGKDIFGTPMVTDLTKMPHLLVAGATGTGKSVFLNALLCSLFYRFAPHELKLLLIDPKLLEFSVYDGIPHLIAEVVTNPRRASAALHGIVAKMEERYRLMADRGVRNIDQYNRVIAKERGAKRPSSDDEAPPPEPLPYIVVVIDEMADLMIVSARDVEEALTRLAQMARAAGIHLVLATQRPSVDVLTGIIKANFPARISFQVSSRTDSRTVMDSNGAERLLGMGDMLFLPPGTSKIERIHGPFISESEVQSIADFLRRQGRPDLDPTIIRLKEESDQKEERGDEYDELYDEAVAVVARHRIASISFIQRRLKIGYNRAARLVEQMETEGVIGPQEGTRPRDVYVQPIED